MANHRLWLFAAARWLLRAPERPHAAGVAPGAWRDPCLTPPAPAATTNARARVAPEA